MAPGTEAPSEMLFYFPDHKALCAAEDATHNLHNLLTLRGAVVRDPHAWATYLTETIDLFGGEVEVVFASHHWPTWGNERVVEFLSLQRDLYAYLHDQTLRMLNKGLIGPEIAEQIALPPALENAWSTRGYYGSVSHNVKAIYQRYLGWFDGNPAHLWEHTAGRAGQAVRRARRRRGRRRREGARVVRRRRLPLGRRGRSTTWSSPSRTTRAARELLADTYEQLGYGSENGTWRNFYLSGATELRDGQFGTPTETNAPDMVAQLSPDDAVRRHRRPGQRPDRRGTRSSRIDVVLTDADERYRLRLANGVLTYSAAPQTGDADVDAHDDHGSAAGARARRPRRADGLARAGIELERRRRRCSAGSTPCSTPATRTSRSSPRDVARPRA